MRWIKGLWALAVVGAGFMAASANATLTVSLVRVPISSAAKSADPTLNNARSYDLKVNQAGEKWNVATLQGTLGTTGNLSGSFYTPSGHTNIHFAASPAYDTSVTTPRFDATQDVSHIDVLGNSDYPSAAGAGATPTVGPTSLNIAWGDKVGNDAGTTGADGLYTIAHITVVGNTGAFLNGYVAGTSGNTAQIFHNLYLPILGDINGDGVVNQLDLNVVNQNFLSTSAPQADFNDDGVVNQLDLNAVNQNFLNNLAAPPGAALGSLVPEPATFGMLGVVIAGVASRRSRRG